MPGTIIVDHSHDFSPDGIRFHMADIYLTELEKVSAGQLGPKQTVTFLQPWILMLQGLNKYAMLRFTSSKLPIAAKTVYS